MNSLETWFTWTGQMQNSDQIFADVQTVSTLQGTQMTAVLNRKPVFLYFFSLDHFGGKCKRADYIFFPYVCTQFDEYTRGNINITLDPCFMGKVLKPNTM